MPKLPTYQVKHFLLVTHAALGHVRLEAGIACQLVKADPQVILTVLVAKSLAPSFSADLPQWSISQEAISRIRVVGFGRSPPAKTFRALEQIMIASVLELHKAYQITVKQGSLTCTATGATFDYQSIPAPTTVIVDLYVLGLAPHVKTTTPNVKIVNIWPTTAGSTLWHQGPAEHGGLHDWEARTKAVFEKGEANGRTFEEVAISMRPPHSGRLLPNADGVMMYDYEREPQDMGVMPPSPAIMGALHRATQLPDASIIATTSDFEPGSSKVLKEWYEGQLGKKIFNFGPLVPFDHVPYLGAAAQGSSKTVFSFLETHPPKSVMLISFGTMALPPGTWQLETLYETLLETRTPFIVPRATVRDRELKRTIQESGVGLFFDWVPQRDVLRHPNLGSFLTHGGNNSMFESIAAGVLNVFWPIWNDQTIHAAYMTQVLDCSWELIQVRTGGGSQPPARGGNVDGTPTTLAAEIKAILSEIKGEVGERKRKNLQTVRQRTLNALAEGGDVDKEVHAFLRFVSG